MTRPGGGGWRCKYGTWHGLSESCHCKPRSALYLPPSPVQPTDLPVEHPQVVRYSIDEQFRVQLKAALTHPAETVVRRPHFAKGYAL